MDAISGDLAFLPLGGTGEIGMNLNLYRCNGKWLAVDCGIGFGGSDQPEVDVMMPDPTFIAERRKELVGLVLTHSHEDHLGAVAWLWRHLKCPVYATPYTAAVLRRKLAEAGLLNEVRVVVHPMGGRFTVGPFDLQYINMAHSLPEAQSLAIRTVHGTIFHSGDWKLDPHPLVGPPTDEDALRALGDEGVLAMVCDSTNATVEGHSGSESEVRRNLAALIKTIPGRVAVTCFASNVARVESIALAAQACGRSAALVGRSLRNLDETARSCGYLKGIPQFVPEDDIGSIPDENLLIICTGSQGEPRSALAKIAADQHPNVVLGDGDTVIFSSRVIPGNERSIHAMQENLARRGVRVMTEKDHMVHVSGHPARDELRRMYALVRPKHSIPVHGEWRHLTAHAELARIAGAHPIVIEDGDIVQIAPGRVDVIDSAPIGRWAVEGTRVVPLDGGGMAARRRMLFNGVVVASLAVDESGKLCGSPRISAPGLLEADDPETKKAAADLAFIISELPGKIRRDDEALSEAARASLRRSLGRRLQKRPLVDVHLIRV